jgi:DNA-binding FrmR family transcriptional regulator
MQKRRYVQKDELRNRVAKIQGQVGGIQRMLDEGRPEEEILIQLSALRNALDQFGARVVAKRLCNEELGVVMQFDQTLILVRRLLR